jgi:phospholipid-translocating ATPase
MAERLNQSIDHEPLLGPQKKLTCKEKLSECFQRHPRHEPRIVQPAKLSWQRLQPTNMVSNTKYSLLTFLPMVLFNQFKFFQNFFFLVMALTQFVKVLKVGMIVTYFAPLVFVLSITIIKEAFEDMKRYIRDRKVARD